MQTTKPDEYNTLTEAIVNNPRYGQRPLVQNRDGYSDA